METDVVEIVADLATGWETTEVAGMTITERIAPLAIGGQVEVYRPSEKMIAAEVIDTAIDTILPEIEEVMEIVIETVDMAAIVIEVMAVEIGIRMIGALMTETTVVIIVVMVSVEAATITIVTAAAVSTTTIAMTAIEDQALIGMIAMIAEAIVIEAMEVTEIITEIAEIITIDEMIVETTVEEAVEVITIVITIDVIVEVMKGEMEDQLIAMMVPENDLDCN